MSASSILTKLLANDSAKCGAFILALGLLAAAAGYSSVYVSCTACARNLQRSQQPELAWLKIEFNLNDAEFKRVSELHSAYLPQCREMCRKIDAQDAQLQRLFANSTDVTPQIERALAQGSQLRAECQIMMLRHFIRVSQTMPPGQGRRYLAWVEGKALLVNNMGQPR
jgi:hypothetical protein